MSLAIEILCFAGHDKEHKVLRSNCKRNSQRLDESEIGACVPALPGHLHFFLFYYLKYVKNDNPPAVSQEAHLISKGCTA